jgi:hypothetical protein
MKQWIPLEGFFFNVFLKHIHDMNYCSSIQQQSVPVDDVLAVL